MKKSLVVFACLTCLINPFLLTGQSPDYQLSSKVNSLVRLLSDEGSPQDKIKVLKFIDDLKSIEKLNSLKKQLDLAEGNEMLQMELNERLGLESRWVGNEAEAYRYYTKALLLAEKLYYCQS